VKGKEEYIEAELNAMRNHCDLLRVRFRPLSKEEWKTVKSILSDLVLCPGA